MHAHHEKKNPSHRSAAKQVSERERVRESERERATSVWAPKRLHYLGPHLSLIARTALHSADFFGRMAPREPLHLYM